MKIPVSIFNDVLGPVMRGQSSSHTAAAARIGKLAAELLGAPVKRVLVEFSPQGSLATTYDGQGSDIGLAAGLLNLDMELPTISDSLQMAQEMGVIIRFEIRMLENNHPSAYQLTLESAEGQKMSMTALSTGGGMIQVVCIDNFQVDIEGGAFELLLYVAGDLEEMERGVYRKFSDIGIENIFGSTKGEIGLLNFKFTKPIEQSALEALLQYTGASAYRCASPILPILSGGDCQVPFTTAAELLATLSDESVGLWELAVKYEAKRGNISEKQVWELATGIYRVMRQAVEEGLAGTTYKDRILDRQSHLMEPAAAKNRLIPAPLVNRISQYTMAVMESKSAFGLIVAAPTAGSCAVIPGAILGCADECGFQEDDIIKALLAAGLIGVFIATRSTFSAEIAGCQAECGSASGMAAAGLVQLMGGNAASALGASSFALQNIMGMVCDPVANRVEVPCLGKNIMAAMNGLSAANISLAGVDTVIPLDEVIAAMDSVGRSLPSALRCTGYGGLSVTPTALKIAEKLKRGENESNKTN